MIAFINRPNGDFTFNGGRQGNAAADFLLGLPVAVPPGPPTNQAQDGVGWLYAGYAQDQWRVLPRLTIERGRPLRTDAAVRRRERSR